MRGWVSCDFICRSWRGRREGEVRCQVRGQVWCQVRGQVRCQVWCQVWCQVRGLAPKMGGEGEKVNR